MWQNCGIGLVIFQIKMKNTDLKTSNHNNKGGLS